MKMSTEGRKALSVREGVRLKAYKDTKGIPTIGIGHTSAAGAPKVTMGMTLTRQEVDEIFARDIVKYESTVNAVLGGKNIPQDCFDALVSLCYNIGQPSFAGSTVARKLKAGDMEGAAEAILMWNKPKEIIGRRNGEYEQFKRGLEAPAEETPAPVPVAPPAKTVPVAPDGEVVIPKPLMQSKTLWGSVIAGLSVVGINGADLLGFVNKIDNPYALGALGLIVGAIGIGIVVWGRLSLRKDHGV